MANEITKVTDKNNVDHPLRDAAAQTALTGILDGQSIDSFGDVESALTGYFLRSEQAVLGAKNRFPFPYYKKSGYEENGLTYTYGNDGIININGTLSSSVSTMVLIYDKGSNLQWLNGLKLSGFTDGSDNTYSIIIGRQESPWTIYTRQKDSDVVISDIPNDNTPVAVKLDVRQSMSNYKVSPMISFDGGTYAPPAKTNKELSNLVMQTVEDVKAAFKSEVVITDSAITDVESAIKIRYGNLLIFNARVNKTGNAVINKNYTLLLTFPETLQATCMVNMNSPKGAGTGSFSYDNKTFAARYTNADDATYIDITIIALVA